MNKIEWFFREGYKTMNKLQQVEFLVEEGGYSEDGAWDLIYGVPEDREFSDMENCTPEDYYEE